MYEALSCYLLDIIGLIMKFRTLSFIAASFGRIVPARQVPQMKIQECGR